MQFTDGLRATSKHETLIDYILPWILENKEDAILRFMNGQSHHIESAPHFALIAPLITADTVVHLVRDGRRTCQSGMIRHWNEGTGSRECPPETGGGGSDGRQADSQGSRHCWALALI